MKTLFIASGNKQSGFNTIAQNQGESLKKMGVEITYFPLHGKGPSGYLKNIFTLHQFIRKNHFDIFHAHYSLSAFVAALSGCRPLIASLMGSDVHTNKLMRPMIGIFAKRFWRATIVKSVDMVNELKMPAAHVIPNGVDMELFRPLEKDAAMARVGFPNKKNIIFVSDPGRPEKNFELAKAAVAKLNDPEIRLHAVFGKSNTELPWYYSVADMLLLTSRWEGSPNVIKEAMACNCPIVATDVGDVREILGHTAGCRVCSHEVADLSAGIREVLAMGMRTKARERINELRLDSVSVSEKIVALYQEALKKT